MACELDSGRLDFSCKTSIGGLKNIYVMNYSSTLIDELSTITAGVITAISSYNATYRFELKADGNTFDETNEISRENGTSLFTQTGTFVLKRQDALSTEALQKLSKMRAQVIIEDHNGNFRLAGLQNGVDFTVGTTSGGAMADLNGYNLSFTGTELELAKFVDPLLISNSISADGFKIADEKIDPNA